MSATPTRGARFLAAFNDLERHFGAALDIHEFESFKRLARRYADHRRLPQEHRDALEVFGNLRNAISHGRYYGGEPIAEPVTDLVEQIEALRDLLLSPPLALEVVGNNNVHAVSPDDPISVALDSVSRFDFSQLPVYRDTHAYAYEALLTTNAIARWLAEQLREKGAGSVDAPVREVLRFAEVHEQATLVPRTITSFEAADLLHGHGEKQPVRALIITRDGRPTDRPLAVIVAYDLSRLSASLHFAPRSSPPT